MKKIFCIFAILTLISPAFAEGEEQQQQINKAAVAAAASYVDGAYNALDSAKQDTLTSSNVTTSGTNGTGAVVTAVTANNGAVTVTKSNVQIPVGSASATTYANIWIQ